ncbi:hypothetical protein MMC13_003502 [Lambiella insularis]|nr:hypothetical protein [Lambiella insularis]
MHSSSSGEAPTLKPPLNGLYDPDLDDFPHEGYKLPSPQEIIAQTGVPEAELRNICYGAISSGDPQPLEAVMGDYVENIVDHPFTHVMFDYFEECIAGKLSGKKNAPHFRPPRGHCPILEMAHSFEPRGYFRMRAGWMRDRSLRLNPERRQAYEAVQAERRGRRELRTRREVQAHTRTHTHTHTHTQAHAPPPAQEEHPARLPAPTLAHLLSMRELNARLRPLPDQAPVSKPLTQATDGVAASIHKGPCGLFVGFKKVGGGDGPACPACDAWKRDVQEYIDDGDEGRCVVV